MHVHEKHSSVVMLMHACPFVVGFQPKIGISIRCSNSKLSIIIYQKNSGKQWNCGTAHAHGRCAYVLCDTQDYTPLTFVTEVHHEWCCKPISIQSQVVCCKFFFLHAGAAIPYTYTHMPPLRLRLKYLTYIYGFIILYNNVTQA